MMPEKLKYISALFAMAVILIGLILAGCSTSGTGSTTPDTSSSPTQTTTPPRSSDLPASTTTNTSTSGSTSSETQGTAPAGRPDGQNMSKEFSRAAEILGITEAQLTGAFQQAQESVFGKASTGGPPSGTFGQQSPEPPSGTSGQQPPPGASDNQTRPQGPGPNQ